MQPYQRASEEIKRQGEAPHRLVKTAASIAGASVPAIGTGIALNRVLPFLSQYIPSDLAIKGLNKIDPRFGGFVNKALQMGNSFEEVKNFIGGKAEEEQEPTKENRNVIEQYSPELHQFLQGEIQQGRSPLEAGALAQANPKFKKAIKDIEKDHKTNWSAILQTIFGGGQQTQQAPQMKQPMQGQAQQQQPQQGQATQQLMAALQAAQQARQRRSGQI